MGSTPLHRNVWASGTAVVDVSGPKTSGTIEPGYIVACQLTIGGKAGADAGLDAEGGLRRYRDGGTAAVSGRSERYGGVTLGPGQAVNFPILDLEYADDFGSEDHTRDNRSTATAAR